MDADVCLECGSATALVSSTLTAPTGTTDRTWRECSVCGWESSYQDVVHR